MHDIETIAAAAAEQIRNGTNMRRDGRAEAIIKEAIEKAIALQPDGMLSGGTQRMDMERAAQVIKK